MNSSQLTTLRNELYDMLPTGKVEAWDMITAVKAMFERFDQVIDQQPSSSGVESAGVWDESAAVPANILYNHEELIIESEEYANKKLGGCDETNHITYEQIAQAFRDGFTINRQITKEAKAIEILKVLVGLKELKDSRGKTEYYLLAQPVVWEKAKQYLESLNKKL